MPAQYRKRPVIVEAVQWDGSNFNDLRAMAGERVHQQDADQTLLVDTGTGTVQLPLSHWLAKGVMGDVYPVHPVAFEQTYEKA